MITAPAAAEAMTPLRDRSVTITGAPEEERLPIQGSWSIRQTTAFLQASEEKRSSGRNLEFLSKWKAKCPYTWKTEQNRAEL
jgi:hypothetical protein